MLKQVAKKEFSKLALSLSSLTLTLTLTRLRVHSYLWFPGDFPTELETTNLLAMTFDAVCMNRTAML